jgi:hypothetical protein
MPTFNIPLSTLTVGTHDFGPAPIADADQIVVLTVDRTVASGFNFLTTATTCQISAWQSNDNGATWNELASAGFPGGISSNHAGQVNSNDIGVNLWPGTSRQARAEVVIACPSSVAVQGTLVTS